MIGLLSSFFRTQEPVIADARPADAAALAAVHARAFRHGWSESEFERLLADPLVACHVARLGRTIAGFVLARLVEDEAEILMVAVDPSAQGRGLGSRLLARHLGRLAASGARRVFLEVDEGNEPAIRLYTRAGFAQVGRRPGYYASRKGAAAALILRRDLV
ncbi:MAG: ribosomal protein S18-alanine N-acetyltransferase [Bradyrhizobiaceae bacterium]|nr:ribosomal protein S18-alanine N-acetyltransferase [Bradyrhizobiaceae bacterium]